MFKVSIAAALLVSSLSVGAAAVRQVTLTTPVMNVFNSTSQHVCIALNVSAAPLVLTLELVDPYGGVVMSSLADETVAPGRATAIASNAYANGYCRVTFQGPAGSVRASTCNWKPGDNCIATLEAR